MLFLSNKERKKKQLNNKIFSDNDAGDYDYDDD